MSKQNQGAADIYAARRKKRIHRLLKRSIIFVVLALVLLLLYQKRDLWLPQLDKIGTKHQTVIQGDSAADGQFPLYVYGAKGGYQAECLDQELAVLSDTYLHIYNTAGKMEDARQHTYGSAMLRTAGSYALVYEAGGTRFRLETAVSTRYEHAVSDSIIFGRVSEQGQVMLVTASQTSACKLIVFNEKGQQVYERSCVQDLVCAAFNADCSGCYAVSLKVSGGVMQSVVHAYSFSKKEDLWSSQPLDMLVISVYNTKDGGLFILGDTASCWMRTGGAVQSTFVYPDPLEQGDCAGERAVLLLRNDEKRTHTVVILNGSSGESVIKVYDTTVKCVRMLQDSRGVLVQQRTRTDTLNPQGAVTASAAVSDSYDGCIQIGSYLFLTGYDRIDRADFRS